MKPGQLKLTLVSRTFNAHCGRCETYDVLTITRTKVHVERILRRRGWVLSGKHGWICPSCAAKRRKRKDGTVEETGT